jgi:hypothetical protein
MNLKIQETIKQQEQNEKHQFFWQFIAQLYKQHQFLVSKVTGRTTWLERTMVIITSLNLMAGG